MLIDDSTSTDVTHDPAYSRGGVPRDYAVQPVGSFRALPSSVKLVPRSEWSARIKERKEQRSGLRFLREVGANGFRIASLDQNGQGYCWSYSIGMALMLARVAAGQPYVRLSPHAVACKIMNHQDRGGWCGLSARFARGEDPNFPGIGGYPDQSVWPQKSMARVNDTEACWANAARHKITHDVADLTRDVWDQNLTVDQVVTLLLTNQGPVVCDWNWWAHSTCMIDVDEVEPGSFGLVGLNSWTDAWGDKGVFTLRGSRMIPDGAIGLLAATPG